MTRIERDHGHGKIFIMGKEIGIDQGKEKINRALDRVLTRKRGEGNKNGDGLIKCIKKD